MRIVGLNEPSCALWICSRETRSRRGPAVAALAAPAGAPPSPPSRRGPPRRPRARPPAVALVVGPDEALDLAHRRRCEAHPCVEGRIAGLEPDGRVAADDRPLLRVAVVVALGLQRLADGLGAADALDRGREPRLAPRGRLLGDRLLGLCLGLLGLRLLRRLRGRLSSRRLRGRLLLRLRHRPGLDRRRGLDGLDGLERRLGVLRLGRGLLLRRRRGLLGLRLLLLGRRPAAAQLVEPREERTAMLLCGIGPLAARPARILKAFDDGDRRRLLLGDADDLRPDTRLLGVDRRRSGRAPQPAAPRPRRAPRPPRADRSGGGSSARRLRLRRGLRSLRLGRPR